MFPTAGRHEVSILIPRVPPCCSVVTPNSFEAELLTGRDISDDASALAACDALHDMGPHTVVCSAEDLEFLRSLLYLTCSSTLKASLHFCQPQLQPTSTQRRGV